jgi:hypothetical protein
MRYGIGRAGTIPCSAHSGCPAKNQVTKADASPVTASVSVIYNCCAHIQRVLQRQRLTAVRHRGVVCACWETEDACVHSGRARSRCRPRWYARKRSRKPLVRDGRFGIRLRLMFSKTNGKNRFKKLAVKVDVSVPQVQLLSGPPAQRHWYGPLEHTTLHKSLLHSGLISEWKLDPSFLLR